MTLDELQDDVTENYSDIDEECTVTLDGETRNELAMLVAAFEPDDPDELLRRGVHALFQTAVETGQLDFHLRSKYDVTYDEYLSGMTYDQMTGGVSGGGNTMPQDDPDDRRYQF